MRIAVLIIVIVTIFGCTSTYQQIDVTGPAAKLLKGGSVVIATPANGSYGTREYPLSGSMTAQAVRAAFAKFTNTISVSADCSELECLKKNAASHFDYCVIPEILQWEDRSTEWSGIKDKLEIKLSIFDGTNWTLLASTILSGKSRWATFGGDHPQDLLPEPLDEYIGSLY